MKMVCINNINSYGYKVDLTINKYYDVKEINPKDVFYNPVYLDQYFIIDDKNIIRFSPKKWFILITKYRKMKLNKLKND